MGNAWEPCISRNYNKSIFFRCKHFHFFSENRSRNCINLSQTLFRRWRCEHFAPNAPKIRMGGRGYFPKILALRAIKSADNEIFKLNLEKKIDGEQSCLFY